MFGFKENVELPDGAEVWTGNSKLSDNGELLQYNGMVSIVDPVTGQEIAYIAAPIAYDNSQIEKDISPDSKDIDEVRATYYLQIEEGSSTLVIITAVSANWLVDDNTIFPVVIDPTIAGSYDELTDTAGVTPAVGFKSCDVAAVDCHTNTNGHYEFDLSNWGGLHQHSPLFDFTFSQGTSLSVGQVTAHYEIGNTEWVDGSERAGLIVMEDCGATSNPDGDTDNLENFANPSGCGGVTDANGVTSSYTPLQAYTPAGPPAGAPVTYTFSDFTYDNGNSGFYYDGYWGEGAMYWCDAESSGSGTGGPVDYTLDITSDETGLCGWGSSDFIKPDTGSDESNGIFVGGQTYDFTVYDTPYADGIDEGLVVFQTRTAATASSAAGSWTNAYLIGDYSNIGATAPYTSTFTNGGAYASQITVASGDEMRLAYHCSYSGWSDDSDECWSDETYVTLVRAVPVPTLSAAAAGTTPGTPTGSEAPSTTFNVASGEEAVFEFTVGI
jgi:hypothetical protein